MTQNGFCKALFSQQRGRRAGFAALSALLCCALLPGCTTGRQGGAAGAKAASGSVLRCIMPTEPISLDPAKLTDIPTSELLANCFEGLVRYSAQNAIEPALAEKWEVSSDGKTYTFFLRKGVRFHNGREFTAEDVKYSFERALHPKTASPVAANYLDGILGVSEVVAGKRTDLPGVKVVDSHTVQVVIDRPRAYLLGMLAYPTGWIVCREAVEKTGGLVAKESAIGTGPFALETWQPGQIVAFRAFADYRDGKPNVDRLEYPVLTNPETAYNNFVTKQADAWFVSVPNTRYLEDKKAGKFASEYRLQPGAQVEYLVLHPRAQPAFAKPGVRKAFAMAIDRAQIIQIAYKSLGDPADGFVPPSIPGAGEPPPRIPYDPAKAKELLAQAGYPGGRGFPALTFTIDSNSRDADAIAQIVRANLRDNLGVQVQIQQLEFGQRLDAARKQKLEFYLSNWIADYLDPQNFLSTLLTSNAPLNRTGYNNPRFDALCAQADVEADASRRASLYSQANRLAMEEVAVLPLVFPARILLAHAYVQGWESNITLMLPHAKTRKAAP